MDSRNPGQAASRLAGLRAVQGAILAVVISLLPLQDVAAHDPGLSSLTIRQQTNGLEATLTLAVKDAAQIAELDENQDGTVTQAEVGRNQSQFNADVASQIVNSPDDKAVKDSIIDSRLDDNNNIEVRLNFHAVGFSSLEIQAKSTASLPLGHREYLQIENSVGERIFERWL